MTEKSNAIKKLKIPIINSENFMLKLIFFIIINIKEIDIYYCISTESDQVCSRGIEEAFEKK